MIREKRQAPKDIHQIYDAHDTTQYLLELERLLIKYLKPNQSLFQARASEEFQDARWLEDIQFAVAQRAKWYRPLDLYRKWRVGLLMWPHHYRHFAISELNIMDSVVMHYSYCRHFGWGFERLQAHVREVIDECRLDHEHAERYLSVIGAEQLESLDIARSNLERAYWELESAYDDIFSQLRYQGACITSIITGNEYPTPSNRLDWAFNSYLCKGALVKAADLRERILPSRKHVPDSYGVRATLWAQTLEHYQEYESQASSLDVITDIVTARKSYQETLQVIDHEIQKTY